MSKQNYFRIRGSEHTDKTSSVSTRKRGGMTIRSNDTSHHDDEAWEVAVILAGVTIDQAKVSIENEIF